MASTGLNLAALTEINGAVEGPKQVLFKNVLETTELSELFTIMPKMFNGHKLAMVGEFGLLGEADKGCNPTWGNSAIDTKEKSWDIAEWAINEAICYKDLKGAFVQYELSDHSDEPEFGKEKWYLAHIVLPRLETAIRKLIFRIAFFGDKNANAYGSAGVLKDGANKKYFTLTDGYWKQILGIVAKDPTRRTTISANAKATYAEQKAEILKNGVATNIMDDMIMSANPALRQAPNQMIVVTNAFKDALDRDIKGNNNGSDLQWKALFNGISESMYNGIRLVAVPFLDEIIQGYETNSANTGWNNPYRAIYTTKDNLLIGTQSTNEIADFNVSFDNYHKLNLISANDTIGALVAHDDMIQVAY